MKHVEYTPRGVCSTKIVFDIDDQGLIRNLAFTNGCNGNLKAIGKLCEGQKAEHIKTLLAGNTCYSRPTSCADQLSKAIAQNLKD